MKLLPVSYKIINPNINSGSNYRSFNKFTDINDTFEPTFTAYEYSEKVNLSQAQNISGIHCPSCGIRMLSPQDYEKLIERADKIETPQELIELLNDYKRYIPNNMRQILSGTENGEYENLTVYDFFQIHKKEAHKKKRERIHTAKDYLRKYAETLPYDKKEFVLKSLEDIHSYQAYKIYKEKILDIEKNLELDKCTTGKINNIVLRNVASSCYYYDCCFNTSDLKNEGKKISDLNPNEIAKRLIANIFKNSVSQTDYLDKHPSYLDNPNNTILICNSCHENSKEKLMFWRSQNNSHLKDNISLYLGDLAKLMGRGKIENANDYIRYVCDISSIGSNGKIKFDEKEIMRLRKVKTLSSRHEDFAPIEQTKVDIPCACCGSVMLPHSIRINIIEEMKKCETPYDYAQILKKYDKYIGHYGKEPANIFLNIINNNPNIPKDKFLKKFRQKIDKYSAIGTRKALERYMDKRSYYFTHQSPEVVEKFDLINARIRNYINSGEFKNYNYLELYENCLGDIDITENGQKAAYKLLTDLKEVAHINSISKISEYDENDKDEIYSIVFKIFRSNVATADHLVAAVNGGDSSKDNLIGLCKGCNTLVKSKKNIYSWYSQNYNVRTNLRKQLHIIDDMAKAGQLEGYNDWAKKIAQTMYENTYRKYDIREEFD